ncbi:glycosyltransferase involved in cell wall biosynthesis [Yonghaparkia alkaliphila]|uniref:Glycosyltransferase involved in cell wall biosynthesis n=1 Tax=Microcella alkalica TaxID=355930 RepID=A0A839E650_9MICO|nr:glycosyltransferase involved in cell wall biosynthesis [Microcella alkalica]
MATNLSSELANRNHDVTVVGGKRSFEGSGSSEPKSIENLDYRLFPSRIAVPGVGFAGIGAPLMLPWLRRNSRNFDVAHIHLARDLTVLPAAVLLQKLNIPMVIQAHGMIVPSPKISARVVDALATKRVLRGARQLLCLTKEEEDASRAVGGQALRTERLLNGVPIPVLPSLSAPPRTVEVAFLARLHKRKRPEFFARSAVELQNEFPDAVFSIAGPDEGAAQSVHRILNAAGSPPSVRVYGAIPPGDVSAHLSRCSVYVLPTVGEALSMSALEAMALGKPAIVTTTCGLAPDIEKYAAGIVVGPEQSALTEAIRTLLSSESMRVRMGANARRLVEEKYSVGAVTTRLEGIYERALGG